MNGRFWCHTDSVELIIFSVISLLSGSSCAYACKSGLNSLLYFNHRVKNIRRRTGENQDTEGESPVPKEQSSTFARIYKHC